MASEIQIPETHIGIFALSFPKQPLDIMPKQEFIKNFTELGDDKFLLYGRKYYLRRNTSYTGWEFFPRPENYKYYAFNNLESMLITDFRYTRRCHIISKMHNFSSFITMLKGCM